MEKESSLLPNDLEAIFHEVSDTLSSGNLGDLHTQRFEHLVKENLQAYYNSLVEFGFGLPEETIEPTSYVLGKLEGYLEALVVMGQESIVRQLESVIGKTMVAAYKARILRIVSN